MVRRIVPALALPVGLALLLLPGSVSTRGADPAKDFPVGNYKFILPVRGDTPLWLLRLDVKDGKPYAAVIATAPKKPGEKQGVPKATVDKVRVADGVLHFQLVLPEGSFDIEVKLPADKKGRLLGSLGVGQDIAPIVLEPTDLTALELSGAEEAQAALQMLGNADELKAKPEEIKEWADKALKHAEAYGPRYHRDVLIDVCEALSEQPKSGALADPYARQAEKLLTDKDSPALRKKVLGILALALEKGGKADEAKMVKARAEAIPFVAPTPFAGRKGNSKRVVLVELFTGAQCPPCVAADLAFDGLAKTYKPAEVILLQHHLHIPRPDALTNADTEERAKFYGPEVRGTPALFLNGKVLPAGGGGAEDAHARYETLTAAINPLLEKGVRVDLKATAKLKDGKIAIEARADAEESGEHIMLRMVLVEEVVAYKGANGIDEHHCVVRAFPGGAAGTAMLTKKGTMSLTVDLEELRKTLTGYLDDKSKERPFPTPDRPMELKKLRVVVFVQNDQTHEVLQAVQVEVAE